MKDLQRREEEEEPKILSEELSSLEDIFVQTFVWINISCHGNCRRGHQSNKPIQYAFNLLWSHNFSCPNRHLCWHHIRRNHKAGNLVVIYWLQMYKLEWESCLKCQQTIPPLAFPSGIIVGAAVAKTTQSFLFPSGANNNNIGQKVIIHHLICMSNGSVVNLPFPLWHLPDGRHNSTVIAKFIGN